MPLIVRIDVDRPYGRRPFLRHLLSRLSSDLYLPRIEGLGYLEELKTVLRTLNGMNARAYVFFRLCTLPSPSVLHLLDEGRHVIGLHLEDSRSLDTFLREKRLLEHHIGRPVVAASKHGSGGAKHGRRHYASYAPDDYVEWARRSGIKVFLGNLEDPTLRPRIEETGLIYYPSAFWLEPSWRDERLFSVEWLLDRARSSDIVLLLHPENVLMDPVLAEAFNRLLSTLHTRILE